MPLHTEGLLEVAQAIGSALDVQDMGFVQQPVKDGGGQHFVAGEKLGPVAHGFVGGDQDRAAAVAVGDQAKEQACFLAIHGLEAQFVDDQEPGGEVLAPAQVRRRPAVR